MTGDQGLYVHRTTLTSWTATISTSQ